MKQVAIVSFGSWTKFVVPVEKLSEFLKATAGYRSVDTGWTKDKLIWYYADATPQIELIDSDKIVTREEYDALREAEKQQEARVAEEELS